MGDAGQSSEQPAGKPSCRAQATHSEKHFTTALLCLQPSSKHMATVEQTVTCRITLRCDTHHEFHSCTPLQPSHGWKSRERCVHPCSSMRQPLHYLLHTNAMVGMAELLLGLCSNQYKALSLLATISPMILQCNVYPAYTRQTSSPAQLWQPQWQIPQFPCRKC